jgi:chloride channel protein, CIC family
MWQANMRGAAGTLTPRFWILAAATGVAAGIGAIVTMAILRAVQHAAFDYHSGEYSTAAAAHGDLRLMLVLVGGGIVAGIGGWVIHAHLGGHGGSPTAAVWSGRDDLSVSRTMVSGALSEVVIGMGASLGREAAPQHAGAAFGAWLGRRFGLPREQRMLLIACGAGAGVGAVYNVPLAGALFAAELYLGSITLSTVAPALLTAAIATVVGWITLPTGSIYHVPLLPSPGPAMLAWSLLAGPLIRLIGWAGDRRPSGRARLARPPVAFAILGAASLAFPLLLGNGRDLAQFAFSGAGALGTLAALAVLKPLLTSLCLRSGAPGGLFTPTLSLGAVLGALFGHLMARLTPGADPALCAVAGAAAMLAAGMQAPIAAVAFTVELTGTVNASMVAILITVAGAVLVVRRLEARSIYSVRLPRPPLPARAAGSEPAEDVAAQLEDARGADDPDRQRATDRRDQQRHAQRQVTAGAEIADLHALRVLEDQHEQQDQHDRAGHERLERSAGSGAGKIARARRLVLDRWRGRGGTLLRRRLAGR